MPSKPNSEQAGTAGAPARASNASVEHVLTQATTPQQFCAALAKLFGVRPTEVALMRLEKGLLNFVHPEQLKTAGRSQFPVLRRLPPILPLPKRQNSSTLS